MINTHKRTYYMFVFIMCHIFKHTLAIINLHQILNTQHYNWHFYVYNIQIRRLNTQTCWKSNQMHKCVCLSVKYHEMGFFNLTWRGYQVAKVAMTTKYKEDLLITITTIPPNTRPLRLSGQLERETHRKQRADGDLNDNSSSDTYSCSSFNHLRW